MSEVVSFTTRGCEPDPPLAPKLINRTKNSLNLQWKVRILLTKASQCDFKTLYDILNFKDGLCMLHETYWSNASLHNALSLRSERSCQAN